MKLENANSYRHNQEIGVTKDDPRFNRSAATFVSLGISEASRRARRRDLAYWLISNKLLEEPGCYFQIRGMDGRYRVGGRYFGQYDFNDVYNRVDLALQRIRKGQLDPYAAANRMVDYMIEQGFANNTIRGSRGSIIRLYLYSRVVSDAPDLNRAVKNVQPVYSGNNRTPSRDQIRALLLASDMKMRTLISMLISTGARPGEIRILRKDQIDYSKTPVQVQLRAAKVFRNRVGFLSTETVLFLNQYLKARRHDSQYIFPGYTDGGGTVLHQPMSAQTTWANLRHTFRKLDLNQKYDKTRYYYRPYAFRILNLDILKTAGFPPDWAEHLIGHNIAFQAAYLPSTSSLAKAWVKFDHLFCFLRNPEEQPRPTEALISKDENSAKINETEITVGRFPREAKRVLIHFPTSRWRSSYFDYVKTNVESADYDKAIADGFSIFDSTPTGIRVFRKRFRGGRRWMKTQYGKLTWKHTDFGKHQRPV